MNLSNPISAGAPSLVARVKAILIHPNHEWDRIEAEPATIARLYTGYAMQLAAIPPAASFVHSVVFGYDFFWGGSVRPPILNALVDAVMYYAVGLVVLYLAALVIDGLATNFGGEKDLTRALKVAVYAMTATWIAGIFALFPLLRLAGPLAFLGMLYSSYLLYLGLPRLMKAPQEQALGYTAVTIVAAILLFAAVAAVAAAIVGPFNSFHGGMIHSG